MIKRRKILGIDASRSSRQHPTGVEQYSTHIIQALLPYVKDFDLRLYTPKWISDFPRRLQVILWCPRLWTVLRLSLEMLLHPPDILFVPAHVFPFFTPRSSFITIHDVAFKRYPEAYGAFQRWYLDWTTRRAVKKSRMALVPTKAVKRDLMRYYRAKAKLILVFPHGLVALTKISQSKIKQTLNHFKLNKNQPLLFFLGSLETKKNLLMLLDAWVDVQKKYEDAHLFLGGSFGKDFSLLSKRIKNKDLSVITSEFLLDSEVAALFHSATAFVFPSLEEGFGLPLLQAFAAGCPVICSDIPALREVGGNAVLYADPKDPETFKRQILRLIEEPFLREELKKKGREQLKKFSWTSAARRLALEFKKAKLHS